MTAAILTYPLLYSGSNHALTMATAGCDATAQSDAYMVAPIAQAGYTIAQAATGDLDQARAALAAIDTSHTGDLRLDGFIGRARAAVLALSGRYDEAAEVTAWSGRQCLAATYVEFAALSLYGAFFTDIRRVWPTEIRGPFEEVINLADPVVFVGLLIGGSLPLLFSGLLIKAVNRAAGLIMAEVRRQLRIPEIANGTKTPDYAQAVTISTQSAQIELIPLGLIAILAPIAVGLLLKEQALGGFLVGVIAVGQLLAVFMSNAGGAWDNAKKHVEDGYHGGKGSENHKASVVGDTVGDPLKDTAGPALNPMIKVMNLVALIVAPIVVQYDGYGIGVIIGVVVSVGLILWAVRRSDRQIEVSESEAIERIADVAAASD